MPNPATPSADAGNVVLVGPRASGKSSVGRALAGALGLGFVDLDEELGQRAGRSASQVLSEDGEAAFRSLEREVVGWASGLREHVVATGGGAVLHGDDFARLARTGTVVYLRPDVEELVERQRAEPRPSLVDGDLAHEVSTLLARREPLYRAAAQIVVEGPMAVSILERLQRFVSAREADDR